MASDTEFRWKWLRAQMSGTNIRALTTWAKVAGETLQWYCEETRNKPTDERNRGSAMRMLAAWLYWEVLPRTSFEDAYDACCRSIDELKDEYPKMWQAAKNAVEVQDACNLTGVMYSFLREISFLGEGIEEGRVPRTLKSHHVVRLYADKICDLAGVKTDESAHEALAE